MSRIGKKQINIPNGVEVKISGNDVEVKGPKGTLFLRLHEWAKAEIKEEDGRRYIIVLIKEENNVRHRAMWGTMAKLLYNMVEGVVNGFSKKLEVNGVGYKVALSGNSLKLDVGFSHPVLFELPKEVLAQVEKNVIILESADKQLLGEVAAQIRKIRKPEPYKGKGIKYMEETIRRKAGKAAKAAA